MLSALMINNSASMGGVFLVLSGAQLQVTASVLANNSALYGGAVAVAGFGQCRIASDTFASDNIATYQGGVVYISVARGSVTIDAAAIIQRNRYAFLVLLCCCLFRLLAVLQGCCRWRRRCILCGGCRLQRLRCTMDRSAVCDRNR